MKTLLPAALSFALVSSTALAALPTTEPSEVLITRLINLQSQNRTPGIAVAMILEGTTKTGPFEASHVRRVVTVHPVIENGRQIRRMNCYDLHWTPAYGWFLWEKRQEAGGEAIWIWSEIQGEIIIR